VTDISATTDYRAPVAHRAVNGTEQSTETVEDRACVRATVQPTVPVETSPRESTVLRLVGGWRSLVEQFGVTESEALTYLDGIARKADDGLDVDLSWVDAPWNGHKVLA